MYMTQQDVNNLLHFAALSAAQKLAVAQNEWESAEALSSAVRQFDPPLGAALDSFTDAYLRWFEFGERISAEGKDGRLSPLESEEHVALVTARDETRQAFIAALRRDG